MSLNSTLYTGLSGIDVNQTRLQVIGNNIANANTVSFKSSRALFKPQFYVTDNAGAPPTASFGGTNPAQAGLGAVVATIEKDFSAGTIESTGRPTDMAIDGNGFFIVDSDKQRYTRDGSFVLNENNQLVSSSGDFVQGYGVDSNGKLEGSLTNVVIPVGSDTIAKATQNVAFKGNLNSDGAVASVGTQLQSQVLVESSGGVVSDTTPLVNLNNLSDGSAAFTNGQTVTLAALCGGRTVPSKTFAVSATSTVGDLKQFFNMNLGLKPSAVTQVPAAGADMVADTTSGVSNAVTFNVDGYYGTQNDLDIKRQNFCDSTGVAPLTFNKATAASGESAYTTMEVYDSLGTPLTMNVSTYMESRGDTGIVWRYIAQSPENTNGDAYVQTGTLTFNNEGQLVTSTGSPMGIIRAGSGAKAMSMYLDFGLMTSLTANQAGASQMLPQSQDGYKLGTLSSFSVGADGQINGSYTNGLTRSIGQVAIATFSNPNGLVDEGGNRFSSNSTSGVPVVTAPGQLGSGMIRSSSLEMSNVDISTEFTNMIVASSGFSASSRVVSTANQLLTDLLQSVR